MTHDQTSSLASSTEDGLGEVAAAPRPGPTQADAPQPDAAQADAALADDVVVEATHADVAGRETAHPDVAAAEAPHPGDPGDATEAPVTAADAADSKVTAANAAKTEVTAADAAEAEATAADAAASEVIAAHGAQAEVAAADAGQAAIASPVAVRSEASPADGSAAAATPAEPDEESLRLAEALVFASAGPVSPRALSQLLPDTADTDAVIAALRARYAGRGVELVDTAGGVQFRTSPDLAPRLRRVIEVPRKLPRVAMETLAIIAYHQPCTRAEIEEIRGTSLSQQTLDALLEANLVAPKGRREVPGRPTLWGTTSQFLVQFGLRDIRDLPLRGDLLLETPQPSGVSNAPPITPDLSDPAPSPGEPNPEH